MIGIPTAPGTWRCELERSQQSLSAVNRFWHGLYGKAVIAPYEMLPVSPADESVGAVVSASVPTGSMYECVGSRASER